MINYLILIYAFVISFPIEIIRPIAIVLILLWITDRENKIELPKTKIFLYFGVFLLYCCISYIWSDVSIKEAWYYIKRYWYFIPAFVIFKYLKKDYFPFLVTAFLSGIFISEVLSYGNYFSFWRIGHGSPSDPTVFMQHSLYGLFLSVAALFLLFKIIYEKRDLYWYVTLCFFITITINVFINSDRTGYFTFLLTLISVVVIKNLKDVRKLLKYTLYAVTFLSLIFISAYNLSDNFKNRLNQIKSEIHVIKTKKTYNKSIGARVGFWIVTKDILEENLLFGTGIGNHNNVKKSIIDEKYGSSKSYVRDLVHFHNVHLEILASYGIIGYLLFLIILVQILVLKIKDPLIRSLKYILIFAFIFSALADNVFYLSQTMSLFALVLGIVLSKYKFENEVKNIKN
jgi:O-antigen ligase